MSILVYAKSSRNHNYILYQIYTMSLINFIQLIVDLIHYHLLKKQNSAASLLMPTQLVLIALEICVYGDSSNLNAQLIFGDIVLFFHYTL